MGATNKLYPSCNFATRRLLHGVRLSETQMSVGLGPRVLVRYQRVHVLDIVSPEFRVSWRRHVLKTLPFRSLVLVRTALSTVLWSGARGGNLHRLDPCLVSFSRIWILYPLPVCLMWTIQVSVLHLIVKLLGLVVGVDVIVGQPPFSHFGRRNKLQINVTLVHLTASVKLLQLSLLHL